MNIAPFLSMGMVCLSEAFSSRPVFLDLSNSNFRMSGLLKDPTHYQVAANEKHCCRLIIREFFSFIKQSFTPCFKGKTAVYVGVGVKINSIGVEDR